MIHVYHVGPHYRVAEVWSGNALGERICVDICRPKSCQSHRARYDVIATFFAARGIVVPPYKPRTTPEPLAWQDTKWNAQRADMRRLRRKLQLTRQADKPAVMKEIEALKAEMKDLR